MSDDSAPEPGGIVPQGRFDEDHPDEDHPDHDHPDHDHPDHGHAGGNPAGSGRFDGLVAVVTGGANGIGRAITQAFTRDGGRVVICDLIDSGFFDGDERVCTVTGDIASPAIAGQVIAEAVARWGKADILVNDAASYPDGTLLETPADDWSRVFDVNVTGTFRMTQAFARHCVQRGADEAAIVSITTGSARSPRLGGGAYSASKAAVETMSKVFAMELGPHNIRVNVVSPGYIDVRQWSEAFPDRAPDDLRAALVESIPLGRAGDPRDIAAAVLFLASPEAGHITGAVLEVDGGSSAGRFTLKKRATSEHSGARG